MRTVTLEFPLSQAAKAPRAPRARAPRTALCVRVMRWSPGILEVGLERDGENVCRDVENARVDLVRRLRRRPLYQSPARAVRSHMRVRAVDGQLLSEGDSYTQVEVVAVLLREKG